MKSPAVQFEAKDSVIAKSKMDTGVLLSKLSRDQLTQTWDSDNERAIITHLKIELKKSEQMRDELADKNASLSKQLKATQEAEDKDPGLKGSAQLRPVLPIYKPIYPHI